MQPGLAVIHANHLETLTEVTVEWLQRHPLAPLEEEWFLVQSNGMAQWLKLKLAADDACGISAAQRFQMPARFLWNAYRSVLGDDAVPATSPYDKSRLLWRLMALLPTLMPQPVFLPLRRFLADDHDQRKRFQLAGRLADLFDQYQVYRADWLALWEQGEADIISPRGERRSLPAEQQWQARLWQVLVNSLEENQRFSSRAHVHQAFLDALANGATPQGLPRRLVVFGISSLPRQSLDALHALSPHCQILMLVQNPCQHYWADIIEDKALLRLQQQRHRQRPSLATVPAEDMPRHGHPLLAAWGKQGRDYIGLLYDYDVPERYRDWFNQIDLFAPVSDRHKAKDSLLARLQQSILDLEPPPQQKQRVDADHSIRFHAAHSPQREVEILHDQLLALLDARHQGDEPLQPRDIIVMVPDIERYAPHIEAVFGNARGEHHIPYTLSDRSQRHQLPFAIALESLLQLPHARFAVGDLLDLLDVPALRARFAIQETDLPQLRRWVREAGIRWGLHGEQRQALGLPAALEQNSWSFGLRRMLLGYLNGDNLSWQGIEPYGEVAGLQATLAGQLHALLSTLHRHWQQLARDATPTEWRRRLQQLLDDLFLLDSEDDLHWCLQLQQALADWLQACDEAGFTDPVPLTVVRDAWLGAVDDGGLAQRFLAGRVNFCTLMPMRSIPFRQVCLLGMNDGDYPRTQLPPDFDLMAGRGQYRPGDRSRRDDDRYLFLEALLSARQGLYISWVARDVRDNHERPPSVLVAQLRDYLDVAFSTEDGPPSEALTTWHPLQPFSRRYFDHSDDRLFSYDHEWRAAHDGDRREVQTLPPLPASDDPLRLDSAALARFLRQPVQLFFSERLKVMFRPPQDTDEDQEPFALDGLVRHDLSRQLIDGALHVAVAEREQSLAQTRARLLRSGQLPLASAGEQVMAELVDEARRALSAEAALSARFHHRDDIRELFLQRRLGDQQVMLEDWLSDLRRDDHSRLARLTVLAGNLKGKAHRLLNDWCRHLLACASGYALESYVIGSDCTQMMTPVPEDQALEWLDTLLSAWLEARNLPLPLACRSGIAFAAAEKAGKSSMDAARRCFEGSGQDARGEVHYDSEQALRRAWPDFNSLCQPQDQGEPVFARLARQLYAPLLDACEERPHE